MTPQTNLPQTTKIKATDSEQILKILKEITKKKNSLMKNFSKDKNDAKKRSLSDLKRTKSVGRTTTFIVSNSAKMTLKTSND